MENIEQEKIKKKKTSIVKFNEQIQTKIINDEFTEDKDFDTEEGEEDFDDDKEMEEDDEEETLIVKEDIYGRMFDNKGNVTKNDSKTTYIPPALRQKLTLTDDNSTIELKRRLQGQLNRLINTCLYQLYNDSLLSSHSLISESLLVEHALLTSLLHTNIGLEIGSYLIENFLKIFIEHINDEVSNKINDNLILFLSYLYSFYMTNGKLLFHIGKYLLTIDQLNEKRLELILLLLKNN